LEKHHLLVGLIGLVTATCGRQLSAQELEKLSIHDGPKQ
jgi:hypothetical protein